MKRTLSILLCLIICIAMFPASAFASLTEAKSAEYKDGTVLRDAYGKTYQFAQQFMIEVRFCK